MEYPKKIDDYLKEHDYFWQNLGPKFDGWHYEVTVAKCQLCGQRNIIRVKLVEMTYEGSRERDSKWLTGGKSPDGRILCDSCLNIAARYDLLKNLERKIELSMEELHGIVKKVNELAEWMKEHE